MWDLFNLEVPMQNAGTIFKVEKASCKLQGCFSNLKSLLAKYRGGFQHQKGPLQKARSFFAVKQAPRKSQDKILKGNGVGDDLGERANSLVLRARCDLG